jgi:hypothetical protein
MSLEYEKSVYSFDVDLKYIQNKEWYTISSGLERVLLDIDNKGFTISDLINIKVGEENGRFFISFYLRNTKGV